MIDYGEQFEREKQRCEKDGNKPSCKWCTDCVISCKEPYGRCYNDIGETVNINDDPCPAFIYDTDLDRW